jgi:hypothetical protein
MPRITVPVDLRVNQQANRSRHADATELAIIGWIRLPTPSPASVLHLTDRTPFITVRSSAGRQSYPVLGPRVAAQGEKWLMLAPLTLPKWRQVRHPRKITTLKCGTTSQHIWRRGMGAPTLRRLAQIPGHQS